MNRRSFPVLRSILSPEALLAEVQHVYQIGPVHKCTLLRSLTNDVYKVLTAEGRYILKVYGSSRRSLGEVTWEVDLLAHLARKGLRVAPAILRSDGSAVGTIEAPEGARHMVLFAYADGERPTGPSLAVYEAFGEAIAHVHAATDDFTSQYPRRPLDVPSFLERPLPIILSRLAHCPEDQAFVLQLASLARDRIAALASHGLTWGVCHGDVSLDNIHIAPDGHIIVYDFDSAGPGWQVSDPYGVMTWVTRGHPDYWDAFLRGYRARRTLSAADAEAFSWFVPLQLIANIGWHLTDWVTWRGSLALDKGYLTHELDVLHQWDRTMLRGGDSSMR